MDHLFWDGKGKTFYPKMKKIPQNNGHKRGVKTGTSFQGNPLLTENSVLPGWQVFKLMKDS